MGKVLSDRINAVKTGAIDQIVKNTAQIETAGTATNAHSVGEYVMISNALYKVTASVAKGDTWTIGTNVTTANIGSEISSLKSDLVDTLYPVGSIYMSVIDKDPGTFIGGRWKRIKDCFLLAAGNKYPAGSEGGEATHTLSAAEMPSHAHIEMANNTFSSPDVRSKLVDSSNNGNAGGFIFDLNKHPLGGWSTTGTVIETMLSGGGKEHNNMPPYVTVYVWLRIDYSLDW